MGATRRHCRPPPDDRRNERSPVYAREERARFVTMFPHGPTRIASLETPAVNNTLCWLLALALMLTPWSRAARAQETPAPTNLQPPADNKKDEPLAKAFSLDKAVQFLDAAAVTWH